MAAKKTSRRTAPGARGYHMGNVDTVISVDDVVREAQKIAEKGPTKQQIAALADNNPYVVIDDRNNFV